jgi:hypothetical protein
MFIIAMAGQKATKKLKFAANPNGLFRKGLGVLFVLIGIAIMSGMDKTFEAWIIDKGYFGALSLETKISDEAAKQLGIE